VIQRLLAWDVGLILSGTLIALLVAQVSRYFAVAYHAVASGFQTICARMEEVSRALGRGPVATLFRVDLPLLRRTLAATATLLAIDLIKELPLTLILRPFNFNTLATRAYEFAVDERLGEAAPYALMIVAVGVFPVVLLQHLGDRKG
jgi:iron(III) transport system permease protein